MKKYIILIIIAASLAACNSKPKTTDNNSTDPIKSDHKSTSIIIFDTLEHDFGNISQNTKPEYYFKYHNTGKEPLALINVSAGCGCTVIDYPKTTLMPNGIDSIHVKFTGTKEGSDFMKTITVQSNASNGTQHLQIKGHQI